MATCTVLLRAAAEARSLKGSDAAELSQIRYGVRLLNTLRHTLLLLLVLLNVVVVGACGWLSARRLTEIERRQIAGRFKAAVERAGGTQVWVKAPPYAPFPPAQAETIEVLTVSATFDQVFSAIEQQAQREGLQIKTKVTRAPEQSRRADFRLARGRQEAGRWLLRETRQLRRAAIIIDDLGQDLEEARKLLALPYPLTFSVLPRLPDSVATAEAAHRAGREVMIHLPMEPLENASVHPGAGEIRVGMTSAEVARMVQQDLASVPYARGANNHMGSRATTHAALMTTVMQALAEERLYFVDSRTTRASVALDAARRRGLPTFFRSVFLDDTTTVAYTLRQLREFRRVIEAQGAALAIGHPYPTTVAALARSLPQLARNDIQLVPASQLLHLPEIAHLAPPPSTDR